MNRLRLSSDILSPIQSDISLDDTSVHSSTSITGTPDFVKCFELSKNRYGDIEKDFNLDSYKIFLKENATAVEQSVDNIEKQSLINATKEDKFKNSYEHLGQSMDELPYNKLPFSAVILPIPNQIDDENSSRSESINSESKESKNKNEPYSFQSQKDTRSPVLPQQKYPVITPRALRRNTAKVSDKVKLDKTNSQQFQKPHSQASESKTGASSRKCGTQNDNSSVKSYKSKSPEMKSSSTQTCNDSLEVLKTKGDVSESMANKRTSKNMKKVENSYGASNSVPFVESKGTSLEKRIQLAISMELDNVRSLMLDQNIRLHKDLLKLQEMTRKQNEVIGCLFSVINELLESNRKLISKHKKV